VLTLITFFFDLCLLRRAPQDLPASDSLLWVTLAADLCAGILVGLASGMSLALSLIQGGAEVAMLLGLLHLGLYLTGRLRRFTQSATALLGSGALISFIAVLPLALNPTGSEDSDAATLGAVLLLALVVWGILVTGHIIRHTFNLTLGQGVGLALAVELLTISVMGLLFGGA
jgi:hypothetical protein